MTERGLVYLVNKCGKFELMNVWGIRVFFDCFIVLFIISFALRIKFRGLFLNVDVIFV